MIEYDSIMRRNEMRATTESYKQFVIAEKEKKRAAMDSMVAPSCVVEMPPIKFNETLFYQ